MTEKIVELLENIYLKLDHIHHTLIEMKEQEKKYWDTWQKAKKKEMKNEKRL